MGQFVMILPPIHDLIKRYREYLEEKKPKEGVAKIHVDEIAAKVASFYERLRSVIEYREEHILRKNFIDRVLRRRLFLKDINLNIAEPLIKEIIRGGRLQNDAVPETKIKEVEQIIENYTILRNRLKLLKDKREESIGKWLMKVTTSAVEECLFPPLKDNMIADAMFWSMRERFAVGGIKMLDNEINLQLFIAIQRALLRVDEDQLNYRLLKFIYPDWNNPGKVNQDDIVRELPFIKERIEEGLKNRYAKYFFRIVNHYNTVFYLIGDIVDYDYSAEEFEAILTDKDRLHEELKNVYEKRFQKERGRLIRLAFFSVLSILLSKILVALAVEIPVDRYITNEFSLAHTLVNIVFPPALMLLIVLSIRMPSEKNLEIVMRETDAFIFTEDKKTYTINVPKKERFFSWASIRLVYLTIFFYSFYALVNILLKLHFSVASIVIFTFFTSLVAATGVKVANRAKEISMEEKKHHFFGFLKDVFAQPFIAVGRWGLATLTKLNILVVIFNLIIELPFQIFIEFLENFRAFIKSKKDEIN